MRRLLLFVSLLALAALLVVPAAAQDEPFQLTILHTNDTHSAHDPNATGYGGAARQASVVNQIREEVENVVLLDAGDRFTGSLYHQQYRGEDQIQIMNAIGYDAMTLGHHEFDDGEDVLLNFVQGLNFPVVSANIDFTAFPDIDELVEPYTILDVSGEQIGVIGLTTSSTPDASSPSDDITFSDDLLGIVTEAVDALTAEGVNKIILVTHTGVEVDLDLMPQLSGVDVFIGGHSHTLFSNTYAAAGDNAYPVVAETPAGEPIIYGQTGSNLQYLGRLDVTFDENGVLTSFGGDTILLSRYITPDAEIEDMLTELSGPIEELRVTPIGAEASGFLNGERSVCRVEECSLGSIIADAMIADTGAQIAIMNGGGVRASIDEGEITLGEVLTVLPFGNLTATFDISGADIIAALENGVSALPVEGDQVMRDGAGGRFPQVGGMRFTFDPTQDVGSRIVSVEVRGEDGEYAPIDPEAIYSVASNDFMRLGGDGYEMFLENAIDPYDFGKPLDQVVAEYMAENSPISGEPEGRITMVNATLQPAE